MTKKRMIILYNNDSILAEPLVVKCLSPTIHLFIYLKIEVTPLTVRPSNSPPVLTKIVASLRDFFQGGICTVVYLTLLHMRGGIS